VGALVSAVLFTVGKMGIGYYLAVSNLASAYGAAGSMVVFLAWVYYSAEILFFGAEVVRLRLPQ
jgi:membrane protein